MRRGTAGFVPDRLVQLREARAISATELAERVGVSRQAISQYERGHQTPAPHVLEKIANTLDVPISHFLRPLAAGTESPIFFRSMASALKSHRGRARRLMGWLHETSMFLGERVRLPTVDLPDLGLDPDPTKASFEEIEDAARGLRTLWNLGEGPISNVTWLLENHGVIVTRAPLDTRTLDGLSGWVEGRPYILVNAATTACRARHDVAHELAHLLMHRRVTQDALNAPGMFKLIEQQAHRFAAAFMLPAAAFAREARPVTLTQFLTLKARWRLSVKLMIRRSTDLKMLSAQEAASLYRSYNYRRWTTGEPYDDTLPCEEPMLLTKAFDLLIIEHIIDAHVVASEIGLHGHEVAQLVGLRTPLVSAIAKIEEPTLASKVPRVGESNVLPFRRPD